MSAVHQPQEDRTGPVFANPPLGRRRAFLGSRGRRCNPLERCPHRYRDGPGTPPVASIFPTRGNWRRKRATLQRPDLLVLWWVEERLPSSSGISHVTQLFYLSLIHISEPTR